MKRVLVLIPTNNIKAYCIGKFISNLRKMDLSEADILFSDDSVNDPEHRKILERTGYEVITVKKTADAKARGEDIPIVQCLANARNALREEFIKRKQYTHALWIDSDVIPPVHTLNILLSDDKDIVSGIYWQKRENDRLAPMVFQYKEKESIELGIHEYADELTVQELFPNRLIEDIPIAAFGTGCFLASRKVMEDERWTFRFNPDRPKTTEDMWFSIDLNNLGYRIFADSRVCCRHHMLSWVGDKR